MIHRSLLRIAVLFDSVGLPTCKPGSHTIRCEGKIPRMRCKSGVEDDQAAKEESEMGVKLVIDPLVYLLSSVF